MPVAAIDPPRPVLSTLAAFGTQPLPAAARGLFAALGYTSQRTLRLSSVAQFRAQFDAQGTLSGRDRESLGQLTALEFLFQLTDAELSTQTDLFTDPGVVDGARIHSYLFFAAELPAGTYSRTVLTSIARALNKPLPMPALVLFKHGETLSLAVLHRRLNKTASDRDVLEKATLIKDVRFAAPHRAHVEILAALAFDSLRAAHSVTNFVQLHAAWRETLDIQELNKRFYQQLQHWYFWALGHARFPADAPKDAEDRDALSLIRLLTRLIFVWFLKEKGLVPENIFDPRQLAKLLCDFAPANARTKDSVYYRAILQNLFFATLNQEPDQRGWAREGQNFMAHSLYRHRDDFAAPATALDLFKDIPFLNGGLFECLDKDLGEGARPRYIRIDGFSRRPDSQPVVPDFLFFGPEQDADLSDFYEEKKSGKKARPVRVRGLISIFQDFKFTVEENTPLEEDVALDPELLGRVFENLLAAYNPETQVTARKQTGSFYTPREIVDYMTGQALFYALRERLQPELTTKIAKDTETGTGEDSSALSALSAVEKKLHSLLAYDDAPNPFNPTETAQLIAAVDDLKILDPACGSGAFPMGVLHRLVHLLGKLDPGNARWKKLQLDKAADIPDPDVRARLAADIEQAFAANELGYGRKLYLIENCLYGVDIQPIAAQITKLRFFISLVVEQRTDAKAPNRGIRPLPNLETKIVAANTLIGITRPGQQLLRNLDIDKKEAELRRVRDEHFLARTPKKKAKCREEDARLRQEIAVLLKEDGWDSDTAKKLSAWDPYDQNAHADFFDNEWMFGLTEGFDMVIGNPPYIDIKALPADDARQFFQIFKTAKNRINVYALFIDRAYQLVGPRGVLAFINPNSLLVSESYSKVRELILNDVAAIVKLPDGVFENASVETMLLFVQRDSGAKTACVAAYGNRDLINFDDVRYVATEKSKWRNDPEFRFNIFSSGGEDLLLAKIEMHPLKFENVAEFCLGLTPYDKYKGHSAHLIESRSYHAPRKLSADYVPLIDGSNITRYFVSGSVSEWLKYGPWLGAPRERRFFTEPRIIVRQIASGRPPRIFAGYTTKELFHSQIGFVIVVPKKPQIPIKVLLALVNSTLLNFYHERRFLDREKVTFQKVLIANVRKFPLVAPSSENSDSIVECVDQILAAKRADPAADTTALEREIDQHVYALYGLTPEDIRIVEESTGAKS